MKLLRTTVPQLYAQLRSGILEVESGWAPAMSRFEAFEKQGRQPVLVATLFGPTGAGKSTLFRLLTGVSVPAGEIEMPTTRSCVAGVPAEFDDIRVASIFPNFRCERLRDMNDLRKSNDDNARLFHIDFQRQIDHLPHVLTDSPDFNSVVDANWAKAERLLGRAEIVLFLVPDGAYANHDTVSQLARCCRLAAHLAYVFTKTDADRARRMWADLLVSKLSITKGDCDFEQRREDGRSLREFLQQSPVYCLPRNQLDLQRMQALETHFPPFTSLLRGLDAGKLILRGLLEPTGLLTNLVRDLLAEREKTLRQINERLVAVENDVRQVAQQVGGGEYPIGRVLELILEEAEMRQSSIFRIFLVPFRWLWYPVNQLVGGIKQWLMGDARERRDRPELEREKLELATNDLTGRWRDRYAEERHADGILGQERLSQVCDLLRASEPPAPADEWESHVRAEFGRWCDENPTRMNLLVSLSAVFKGVALALIVIDLTVIGGQGLILAAGAGGVAGLILDLAKRLNLQRVIEVADERWRAQRTAEIEGYLNEQFLKPIFHDWYVKRDKLESLPVAECQEAVDSLTALADGLRTGDHP